MLRTCKFWNTKLHKHFWAAFMQWNSLELFLAINNGDAKIFSSNNCKNCASGKCSASTEEDSLWFLSRLRILANSSDWIFKAASDWFERCGFRALNSSRFRSNDKMSKEKVWDHYKSEATNNCVVKNWLKSVHLAIYIFQSVTNFLGIWWI